MRRMAIVVCGLAILSMWAVTPGLADAGIGGMFVDVPTTHSAYRAIQDLVSRGVILMRAGGEFAGNAPLLRYDAAEWLSRAITNVESARTATTDLTPRLTTLETRVTSIDSTMTRELQAIRAQLAAVSQTPGQAQIAAVEQRAQTAFIVGVTGVVLAIAAIALAFWF